MVPFLITDVYNIHVRLPTEVVEALFYSRGGPQYLTSVIHGCRHLISVLLNTCPYSRIGLDTQTRLYGLEFWQHCGKQYDVNKYIKI